MEFALILSLVVSIVLGYLYLKKCNVNSELEKELITLKTKETYLSESFKNLSADIFQRNSHTFLELASARLEKWQEGAKSDLANREKTIKDTLERYEKKIQEFSKDFNEKAIGLDQHLKNLVVSQGQLKQETHNLSKALRQPHVRGRWGEIQLKRVVEMAGMVEYCDFATQETSSQSRLRPDMIVRLPNDRQIIVDSKAPLFAYLEALERGTEEEKLEQLKSFAKHIKTHIQQLSQKSYWDQFSPTPEFVVLFLPGETFFSAALEQDPTLIELGVEQKVLIATPTTLIALLRSVAYGWRQEKVAKNADEISNLGRELYKRLLTLSEHFDKLRGSLHNSVDHFNRLSASLESRVFITARKFKEHGATQEDEIEAPTTIDQIPKIPVFDK